MIASLGDFLQRLLHQGHEDKQYFVTSPPTPEILRKAVSSVRGEIGFEAHLRHFNLLAEVIDFCVQEHVNAALGKGSAFPNTLKHPRILALGNLDPKDLVGVICAAAQGVKWIDEIQPWVPWHTLQNEIAKRTLIGVLRCFSKKKQCFSAADLKVLMRLGGSIRGQDSFGIIAQMTILETLATNAASLTIDNETKTLLPPYLDYVATQSNLAYVVKAIDKLRSKLKTN